jgi:hypothetical protein
MTESDRRESPVESLTTVPDHAEPRSQPATTRSTAVAFRLTIASIWTIVILVLCWTPKSVIEEVENGSRWFDIPNVDKVVHWGIFVVFTVLWLRIGTSRWWYAWVALGGLAVAAVSEIVQTLLWIGRDGSLHDGITDMIGVVIGLIVARWIEPLLRGLESRLFPGWTS